MQVMLTVTAGPHKGRVFTFAGHDTFLVGRSKRTHFQLPTKDRYFSRIHFMVEVNPPQCRLTDMGSRNGTYVNGARVSAADLNDGDQIRAGRSVLQVAVQREEPTPPATPVAPDASTVTRPPPTDPGTAHEAEPVPALATLYDAPEARSPSTVRFDATVPACRVCGSPVGSTEILDRPAAKAANDLPLCPACSALIRNQPQPIAAYQLIREVGRGGMGTVHLAMRLADATLVAVKMVTPAASGSRTTIERFLREAKILCELNHPNIVAFREMGEAHGQLYFAMEYVPGADAGRLLKERGALPLPRAVSLVCQLLQALEYAHAKGFVHRDIKPSNLLVSEESGSDEVKLADFGLARVYQASNLSGLTLTGSTGGTVAFMPPEHITNFRMVKPAADQYAAAATLYKLLTDKFVYDLPKKFDQQLLMILQEDPVPLRTRRPDLPAELAAVVHRGLARDPAGRYPDAKAMRQALLPFCQA
jgi:serine/threonine-protein kinase